MVLRRLSRRRKSHESRLVTSLRVYDSGIRIKSKPKRSLTAVTRSVTNILFHNDREESEHEVSAEVDIILWIAFLLVYHLNFLF